MAKPTNQATTVSTKKEGGQSSAPPSDAVSAKRASRPKLAVYKFASCDGCQLALLSVEDKLLTLADRVEIAYFLEASSKIVPGPYDIGIVEGSVTTEEDAHRIRQIRNDCGFLITIGACATAGGIQALKNWGNVEAFIQQVYANPMYINSLATSTAIAAHVKVDFELRGCPIDANQLVRVLGDVLAGRQPRVPRYSVCIECKLRATVCVAVARGIACLGPVTQAGCGALCPAYDRECFGCFGPQQKPNLVSLTNHLQQRGHVADQLVRLIRNFNSDASEFRQAGNALEQARAGHSNTGSR
ncbi:MAG TPA: oxidoreductase [Pirellulaceae bacterium]|nr:oxidoreductase [Pirellulaceae bacterium]HMO91134.1 oxidoreductase [Pirellulaceae bacterium]HMP71073.1 oxidoreductase [Pirellulaceae bacterium]